MLIFGKIFKDQIFPFNIHTYFLFNFMFDFFNYINLHCTIQDKKYMILKIEIIMAKHFKQKHSENQVILYIIYLNSF